MGIQNRVMVHKKDEAVLPNCRLFFLSLLRLMKYEEAHKFNIGAKLFFFPLMFVEKPTGSDLPAAGRSELMRQKIYRVMTSPVAGAVQGGTLGLSLLLVQLTR